MNRQGQEIIPIWTRAEMILTRAEMILTRAQMILTRAQMILHRVWIMGGFSLAKGAAKGHPTKPRSHPGVPK